ncbi:hypothetical protein [Oryza sativa Japonica Group]|uniref:Uncharacterized protein n=1 Tax=Oryza sativa subsp. japonica TaxID=39947 RepID=Q5VPD4_ORYSJ|nr:hypothetical protein [Oryza sativa Japonica Group]
MATAVGGRRTRAAAVGGRRTRAVGRRDDTRAAGGTRDLELKASQTLFNKSPTPT